MDIEKIRQRIEKLKKEINYHNYLYHVLDKPEISDAIFDSLRNELKDLEKQFPELISPDSPTQRAGAEPLKSFKKVEHKNPMLSLTDAFSEQEISEWEERYSDFLQHNLESQKNKYYCELKIDGLAIELIYRDGTFSIGATRGDGTTGEDVTQNLKTVNSIPLKILDKEIIIENLKKLGLEQSANLFKDQFSKEIIVRGEVFMNKKDFEALNADQKNSDAKTYANPRNVAAGSVRQLDSKITASRKLDFFAYSLITDLGQKTHEDEHAILKSIGFKTNSYATTAKNINEVFAYQKNIEKIRERLPYEIDGTVIILNSESDFARAGIVGRKPRAAIAFKFAAREATTKILNIQIQVGRTGTLTPVAIMQPVPLGGIIISRASLHNYDEIQRLEVKIGDTVIINRAGDVIPQVVKVMKELRDGTEKNFKMPQKCPICNSEIEKDSDEVAYRCINKNCFAQIREGLDHFVSKSAFDISGVGPKIIDKLLDENLIHDASDLFELTIGDLEVLERFGEKSAQNIVNSIQSKKEIPLKKFIYSLGILHVGEETATLLAQRISNPKSPISKINDLIEIIKKMTLEQLQEIPDIGPKVAQSIFDWFHSEKNIEFLKKLEGMEIKIIPEQKTKKNQKLNGLNFVLTGHLENMSRELAKEKIRELGGKISESVSKQTNYVVAGTEPGSKYEKAKELNIKIINEIEFLDLIK